MSCSKTTAPASPLADCKLVVVFSASAATQRCNDLILPRIGELHLGDCVIREAGTVLQADQDDLENHLADRTGHTVFPERPARAGNERTCRATKSIANHKKKK